MATIKFEVTHVARVLPLLDSAAFTLAFRSPVACLQTALCRSVHGYLQCLLCKVEVGKFRPKVTVRISRKRLWPTLKKVTVCFNNNNNCYFCCFCYYLWGPEGEAPVLGSHSRQGDQRPPQGGALGAPPLAPQTSRPSWQEVEGGDSWGTL